MLRKLLRDGAFVGDDWRYLAETGADLELGVTTPGVTTPGVTTPGVTTPGVTTPGVILSVDEWLADQVKWAAAPVRLGVVLAPAQPVELLLPQLARFALIAAHFPGPSEGRGYTQGRMLRERFGFRGELRATGYVRRDQLFFLARCGFNSFELPDADLAAAGSALATFSAEYQQANDAGLRVKLRHRSA